jgi:PAS domain S-box-containing protein
MSNSKIVLTDLAESDRFQILIDAVKDYAIYLLDADGYVATWNTGAERFKGYPADEIIGRHFSTFYTQEDKAVGLPGRALATAAKEGRFEAEGWRIRKDGTRFWTHVVIDPVYDDSDNVIGYAKITRDISEKKAVDEELLASERKFKLLVQGVKDYAIYLLDPNGLVTNWNAGAQTIKGYSEKEIVGQHFSIFYTEEDRAKGKPAIALATAVLKGKFEGEAQRVRKSGERFWAHVLIDPIHDETGKLVGFAKVTRDITERRKAQEELERSRVALAQAQKLEALGRLTGGVAHDFNNLLTVIRVSIDFLQREDLTKVRQARYVKAIADTTSRATALVGQLLAFARRQPLAPEVFEIGARIRGLDEIVKTTLGGLIELEVIVSTELFIDADPSQFDTAVLNMAVNARDAMPTGGCLTIAVTAVDAIPAVRGHSGARGDFVVVSITDTGTGMDEATLTCIFEPFFTTKEVDKGTGLGLSQVYGFAKQSGGEVDATSELGAGTTFKLYLPRSPRQVEAAEQKPRQPAAALAQLAILVVEDNQAVGSFAAELLTELGHSVRWVGDAQSALELLRSQGEHYDLLFSDVVMPGMTGLELAQVAKVEFPDLEIVLTSGYSHVLASGGTYGFTLLKKPYSVEGVLGALRRRLSSP